MSIIGGWVIYRIMFTLNHLPEAYAAWDTGDLLVEYIRRRFHPCLLNTLVFLTTLIAVFGYDCRQRCCSR
jgi:hypothetical protein